MQPIKERYPAIDREIVNAYTRRVWEYWCEKTGVLGAPTWADFELMDIYDAAPIVLILDIETANQSMAMKYRFVGTDIVASRHKMAVPDTTGMYFDDAEHQYDFSDVRKLYYSCATKKEPCHLVRAYDALDAYGEKERLVLPILRPDGEIDKVISVRARLTETHKY